MSDPLVSLRARAEQMAGDRVPLWSAELLALLDRLEAAEKDNELRALDQQQFVAALEAAERERDIATQDVSIFANCLGVERERAEAAEARLREVHTELEKSRSELLAAQQALREIVDWEFEREPTSDERAIRATARAALVAVGRDPAQEDKP